MERMAGMSKATFWRVAAVQLIAVAALSIVLAIALPHSFFEDWGWLAGPAAWLACAALTARLLGLPLGRPCWARSSPGSPARLPC